MAAAQGEFIAFKNDKYGTYDVISTFTAVNYISSSTTSKVTVSKNSINVSLRIDDTSQNANPIAKVTSDTAFGAKLTIGSKVYSINVRSGLTSYTIPDKLASGRYSAVLSFAGNDFFNIVEFVESFDRCGVVDVGM